MTELAAEVDASPAGPGWRERALVPCLVMTCLVTAMISSLGAPLIPTIALVDHVSISTSQWALTATLLTGAIVTPIMGQLSDGGRRRMVIVGALTIVAVGSVVSAVSTNFATLVAGRAMQGAGLGLVPTAMVIARHHLPTRRSTNVIGLLSVTGALGVGLGYPLTGLIADAFDYRVAYWFGGGVVGLSLLVALVVLPRDDRSASSHLDVFGSIQFAIAAVALLTAVSEGGQWGWASAWVLGLFALAVVGGLWWLKRALTVDRPLVVVRHLRIRTVWVTILCAAFVGISMYLFIPVVVEFVQIPRSAGYGFGASVVVAGLCLVPLSVGTALANPVVTRLRERIDNRFIILIGQVPLVAGFVFFALRHADLWEAFVTMGVCGFGIGITFAVLPGFVAASVPAREIGSAMGLYQVVRSVGLSVGSALAGSILASFTPVHRDVPKVEGYSVVLLTAAAACVVLAGLSLLLPRTSVSPGPVAEATEVAESATLT